jgi:hypothetical protein
VDPRSGRPVAGGVSVTVVAKDGTAADALATALLTLGPSRGMALVESIDGADALFVVGGAEENRAADGGNPYALLASSGLVGRVAIVAADAVSAPTELQPSQALP